MLAHALTWSQPTAQLDLGPNDIHLWRILLDEAPGMVESFFHVLAEEEQERTQRYGCQATRGRFVVGRGLLRTILGDYLGQKPRAIEFTVNQAGKPILLGCSDVHFNVSHSHNLVVIAVTARCELGVDVERLRPFSNELGLAERYFSPRECRILRMLSPERRTEAFFHTWTRKEACLKALGVGLSYGLDQVEVSIYPEEPTRLVRLNGEENHAVPWSLLSLAPAPGYVGALALKAHGCRLSGWHWPEVG